MVCGPYYIMVRLLSLLPAAGRAFAEDGLDALHVELGTAVLEIDAVLLLLYVGELCVAISPHVVGYFHQGIHLSLKA